MHKYISLIDRWYYGTIPRIDSDAFISTLCKSTLLFVCESDKQVVDLVFGEYAEYSPQRAQLYLHSWLLDYSRLAGIYPKLGELPLPHMILGLWNGEICLEGVRWRLFPDPRNELDTGLLYECQSVLQNWHIRNDQRGRPTECFTGFYCAFLDNEYALEDTLRTFQTTKNKQEMLSAILRLVGMYRTIERRDHPLWREPIWSDIAALLQQAEIKNIEEDSAKLQELILKLLPEDESEPANSPYQKPLTHQPLPSANSDVEVPADFYFNDRDIRWEALQLLQQPDRTGEIRPVVEVELPERGYASVEKDTRFADLAKGFQQIRAPRAVRSSAKDQGLRMHRHLIHRIATDQRVFAHTEKVQQTGEPEVIFLLDASGSMKTNNLWKRVLTAAWAAHDSLFQSRIACQTWAHTTIKTPEEVPCVYPIAIDRSIAANWQRAYNITLRNNVDGYAIQHISTKFRYPDKQPVLIVWSDGEPAAINYDGEIAKTHTQQMVANLRKRGIFVFAVSLIEHVIDSNEVIYGRDNNIDASYDLAAQIRKLLRSIVTYK